MPVFLILENTGETVKAALLSCPLGSAASLLLAAPDSVCAALVECAPWTALRVVSCFLQLETV